jgi:hypothetical protein
MLEKRDTIFICYAREDKNLVENLYRTLKRLELSPWMDEPPSPYKKDGIPPGADWDLAIREKLKEAMLVFACFSKKSIDKEGYYQRELRLALDRMNEMPLGRTFVVPILLEECTPRDLKVDTVTLGSKQWYHYYRDGIDGLSEMIVKLRGTQRPRLTPAADLLSIEPKTPMQTEEEALILLHRSTALQSAAVEAADAYARDLDTFVNSFAIINDKLRTLVESAPRSLSKQAKSLAKEAAALFVNQNRAERNRRLAMSQNLEALEDAYQKLFASLSDQQWVDSSVIELQRPRIAELRRSLQELLAKNKELIEVIACWRRFTTEHNRAKRLRLEELKQLSTDLLSWLESLDRSEDVLDQALRYVSD